MGWSDLDKEPNKGSGLAGRFVKFDSKQSTRVRFLDEDPTTTFVHKVKGQPTEKEPDGVFRSIQATPSLDDDYIQKMNGKRFPAVAQYSMRCFEFKRDDKGKFTDEGEIKILQGGPAIFKQLRTIMDESGSLRNYDIIITKEGEGRDTEYTVTASPLSRNINVDERIVELEADETLKWENVFKPITAAEQQKILIDAKIDITYDPVGKLAENMSVEQALGVTIPFGKYKNKTVQDVLVIDASWTEWASENVTSNDAVAAACRVAFGHMNRVASGDTPQPQLPAATPSAAKKSAAAPKGQSAKAPAPSVNVERQALVASVSAKLEDLSPPEIVSTIEKYGEGKRKLKDLSDDQLKALDAAL